MNQRRILSTLDGMFSDRALFLHEPEFNSIQKSWFRMYSVFLVSSIGSFVTQFETCLAEACGVKHAVAMVNGTSALEVGLRVGVKAGSEVLVPSLTLWPPNAVSHLGAISLC